MSVSICIINIAPSIMVIGGAAVLTTMLPADLPAFATVIIAVLAEVIAGMVYSPRPSRPSI